MRGHDGNCGRGGTRGRGSSHGHGGSQGRGGTRGRGSSRERGGTRGRGSRRGRGGTCGRGGSQGRGRRVDNDEIEWHEIKDRSTYSPSTLPPFQETAGPTFTMPSDAAPIDFFQLFITDDIL